MRGWENWVGDFFLSDEGVEFFRSGMRIDFCSCLTSMNVIKRLFSEEKTIEFGYMKYKLQGGSILLCAGGGWIFLSCRPSYPTPH